MAVVRRIIVAAAMAAAACGTAETRIPERDDVVLARVAPGARAGARPETLGEAVAQARRYIRLSRETWDPRYLGWAQASLAAWWDLPSPPQQVLVLRATIRQSNHEFEAALVDLDRAVAMEPEDAQAWLTRAVVQGVRGDVAGARESCERLRGIDGVRALVIEACVAGIAQTGGGAREAEARLAETLAADRGRSGEGVRAWALSILGDLAAHRGDRAEAERRMRQALAIDSNDGYVLAALADVMLDEGRDEEVLALLDGRTENDGLLLRAAIAETRIAGGVGGGMAERAKEMKRRIEASRARGDRIHLREEARFELEIEGDVEEALRLARENFAVQREAADARLLAECAVRAILVRRGAR
jgi:Tfp pilus assembly protein PilF